MKIITAGARYADIDAYAGCIAYAELLQQQGQIAQAVITAVPNQSIPSIVREWPTNLQTAYKPSEDDTFTLIDVSEPEYFESFVDQDRIDEVIDHHPGLEQYWQQRIGSGAIIEHVGAACTQIFEKWEQSGALDKMSKTSARLLMCGILDNTLNFGAKITTDRDRHAYDELSKLAQLPADWPAQYFDACQVGIVSDLPQSIKDDTKNMSGFKTFPEAITVGQLAIWDGPELASDSFEMLKKVLTQEQQMWLMNIISIKDGRSYFVSDSPEVVAWISELLGVSFKDSVAVADRMWLRKEIKKADILKASA
jgi:inorganic pyrophosphatase/exopolyphosphatase